MYEFWYDYIIRMIKIPYEISRSSKKEKRIQPPDLRKNLPHRTSERITDKNKKLTITGPAKPL